MGIAEWALAPWKSRWNDKPGTTLASVGKPVWSSWDSHSKRRSREAWRSHDASIRSYCTFVHHFPPGCQAFLRSWLVNTYSSFKTQTTPFNLPESEIDLVLLQKLFRMYSNHQSQSVFTANQQALQRHSVLLHCSKMALPRAFIQCLLEPCHSPARGYIHVRSFWSCLCQWIWLQRNAWVLGHKNEGLSCSVGTQPPCHVEGSLRPWRSPWRRPHGEKTRTHSDSQHQLSSYVKQPSQKGIRQAPRNATLADPSWNTAQLLLPILPNCRSESKINDSCLKSYVLELSCSNR